MLRHQMSVGLLCAAAGQAVGTLAEWSHVNPNADRYIMVEGNLADGLSIIAKAGSQTWTIKVG
ncbi:hypothetical protein [Thermococcus sp. AM4]|uniref:hypothetical protein n=1 Tax=Thermococcus sp. (strain AM4) TaxID=246969 RepID=UPI0001871379|nr:hypothetical protein [Thermococcus sp. AM4]EEB73339.1 hypothetical protein TAM4_2196 [Thermococcus sp. AM4]